MNLVHLTGYFMPELGYQEHYLATEQVKAGHAVTIITSSRAYPPQVDYRALREFYPNRQVEPGFASHPNGYTIHRLRTTVEHNSQVILKGMTAALQKANPDGVFLHGASRLETLRALRFLTRHLPNTPCVVDDHTHLSAYYPTMYRRLYHAFVRYRLTRAPAPQVRFAAISGETAAFMSERLGLDSRQITIIPLGADASLFTFDPQGRQRVRAQLGIADAAYVILYVGKLIRQKGVDQLLEAAMPLLSSRPDVYLMYVGSGANEEFGQALKNRASRSGVSKQVIFTGHQGRADLPSFFSAGDVAVWPTQETMAALEAASCGLPLVLSDSDIAHEYLAGDNGIACGTASDLRDALRTLYEQRAYGAALGARGAEFVRETRNWSRMADRFMQLLVSDA